MMASGVILTSFAPIALLVGAVGALSDKDNVAAGGVGAALMLAGVGIPLTVIGARREPTAFLTPWAAPKSAGLGLLLRL